MVTKYRENIRIYNHFADYRGQLLMQTLSDLLNDVAEGHTLELGVDVNTLNKDNMTWMLHSMHIKIDEMPVYGEQVVIETWPSGIDRLFALRDYQMYRESGEILATAVSEWMLIDLTRRRPIRQTPKIVEMSTSHQLEKLSMEKLLDDKEMGEKMEQYRAFTATYEHIDFNGHVTLTSYMGWLVSSLPFSFLKQHILKEVEIIYKHEIMPESDVKAYYKIETDNGRVVVSHKITDNDDTIEHCIAVTIWGEAD